MGSLDSASISADLVSHVHDTLEESSFFSDLRAGTADIDVVRDVFGQYYLWRNRFHRWFGVCIVKSPAFGTAFDTSFVLSKLVEHIEEEINGDHHGMAVKFLRSLGINNPELITPLPVTQSYADSFLHRYLDPRRSGEEALAALAGREIVAPERNRVTIEAMRRHYQVNEGLDFFGLHEELEVEHFKSLWNALIKGYEADEATLAEAARHEIWEHVTFWDDVHAAVTGAREGVSV